MRKILVLIVVSLIHQLLLAQFNETIRTGRPGQAIGPFAVGKNVFQTQTGFDFGGTNGNNNFSSNYIAPNTVLRYGVSETFEINSAWEYRSDTYNDKNFSTNGLSTATIGTRINLRQGGATNTPSIGLQATLKLPILSKAYNPNYIAPKILIIASQKISDKFSGLINFGINYNGVTPKPNGLYILNLGYAINDKWGTFAEMYGNFDDDIMQKNWDTGLSYLATNNLQFDIYGGYNSNNNVNDYFVSIGVSWRIAPKSN